jgi:hypothetical protein
MLAEARRDTVGESVGAGPSVAVERRTIPLPRPERRPSR